LVEAGFVAFAAVAIFFFCSHGTHGGLIVLISLAIMWELPKNTDPYGFAAIPSCSVCFFAPARFGTE
jgi:hypothetical protein